MTEAAGQTVIGLGEVLWDCFGDSRRVGGAPANVAFHSQLLGQRGFVCSRVGNDDLGHELRRYLVDAGLDTRFPQTDAHRPTGRVTVDDSDPQAPCYTIHEGVAWDALEYEASIAKLMQGAAAVCFGTLAQRADGSRETIHRALADAGRALIVYDVNLRQSWYTREWIERSLRACRVVKLNVDELAVLAAVLETGDADAVDFSRQVQSRFGVDLVCVTRGGAGCLLLRREEVVDLPGEPVQVADAVGAGDAFCAALIFGLLRNWSLERVAAFANRVGGLTASRRGAMPPLRDEYATLVKETDDGGAK